MGTEDVKYLRKAILFVDGSREGNAVNVNCTPSNKAGIRKADVSVGVFDDLSPADCALAFDVMIPTKGSKDYFGMVVNPGQRFHSFRFSSADGVLEVFAAVNSVGEVQPQEDGAGHTRSITANGVVKNWKRSSTA